MSFKNFYLAEADGVDKEQQKPVEPTQDKKPQPEKPQEKPQATQQPEQKPEQPKQPERKNKSLFGGKLYDNVSKLSKGFSKVTDSIVKQYQPFIAGLKKMGPGGEKIANAIDTVKTKAETLKDKHPAAFSFIMNVTVGAVGTMLGNAAGKEVVERRYAEVISQVKEISEKVGQTKGEYNKKIDIDRELNPDAGDKAVDADAYRDKWQNRAQETASNDAVAAMLAKMSPEELKKFNELLENGSMVLNITGKADANIGVAHPMAGDGWKEIIKGNVSGTATASLQLAPHIMQLANPSVAGLGQALLSATINALDKVDKKQMPASKYIATVVSKVKDEKKKKEMLASFIRMRSKQI